MTTRRLDLAWRPGETDAGARWPRLVARLGYRLVPYDVRCLDASGAREEKELLRAMAVAGFAAGNVMLLSVSIWAGHAEGMGPATRTFLHWMSALIALPAIAYAGRPFFRAAVGALRARRVTMDVPISLGVLLASAMSLHETIVGGTHAYFDAAITLLFFLLVGRYLDRPHPRPRPLGGRAPAGAVGLRGHRARTRTAAAASCRRRRVRPGMRVVVAAGERIGVDGRVLQGESAIDTSLIDGESAPKPAAPGIAVFAGTLNQIAPLVIEVTAVGDGTLLAEIARLVEACEQQRGRYVVLADRVARLYAPVVHLAALTTFLLWWAAFGVAWQTALMNAIAVLIITCPCALGLAVPAVQVIASGRLLRRGLLVKSATALERLAEVDTVVFDKTGTLTEGRPAAAPTAPPSPARRLHAAAALAAASRHPAGARAGPDLRERRPAPCRWRRACARWPGRAWRPATAGGAVRLGSRAFCGTRRRRRRRRRLRALAGAPGQRPGALRLCRSAARRCRRGRRPAGARAACGSRCCRATGRRRWRRRRDAIGIADWTAGLRPAGEGGAAGRPGRPRPPRPDGRRRPERRAGAGLGATPRCRRPRPIDISQTAADVVFQGARLAPVVEALGVARARPRPDPPEPGAVARLQPAGGAAGDGRPGDAAARRDRHVDLLDHGHRQRPAAQPHAGVDSASAAASGPA